MAIEIYKSDYITAESAENYIDKVTIEKACNNIKFTVDALKKTGVKIEESKKYCGEKQLSIDGINFEKDITTCANGYGDTANYMDVFSTALLAALTIAIDKKQEELNKIAIAKEKLIMEKMKINNEV